MSPTKKYDPPQSTAGDHAHMLARAGIASIPVVGNAAVELFQAVIEPPLRKRQGKWMADMADGLIELEEKQKCVVDELRDNDSFIDTVMQASQAAIKTSHEEKWVALRNAVLNAALPNPPDESHQAMFVGFVDTLTVWHLRLLRLLANPRKWFKENDKKAPEFAITGSIGAMLEAAYPELKGQDDFVGLCIEDLMARGLLKKFGYQAMMSGDGPYANRSATFGDNFLAFVTAPT